MVEVCAQSTVVSGECEAITCKNIVISLALLGTRDGRIYHATMPGVVDFRVGFITIARLFHKRPASEQCRLLPDK